MTHTQRYRHRDRQTDGQVDNRETEIQTDQWADNRQAEWQTGIN